MGQEGYFSTAEENNQSIKIVHPKSHPKIDADLSELSNLRQWELGQGK